MSTAKSRWAVHCEWICDGHWDQRSYKVKAYTKEEAYDMVWDMLPDHAKNCPDLKIKIGKSWF